MKIQLYKYDGTPLFEVMVDASSSQSWSLMSDNKLSLSFELEECVVLTAGCYIEFDNTRFYLLTEYKPTMVCRSAWKYDLTLGDAASWLSITLALKTTDGENAPLFKYTGPAVEHAAIIVANLNRLMGTDKWKVGSVISTENITIDYSGKYCSEVLQEIVDIKNTEWWIDDMTLNIGRAEFGDPIELGYQNGLLGDIIREQSDNSKSYRYLYPVGSTRNIDPTKYGYDRLQLPDGRTYIDMNVEQGIAELFEEAAFAHIFPRYEGTVQTVRAQIANGNSGPFVIYYFSDSNLPFNPNDYEIAGLKKQISFLSGELMGEDFEVNYNPSSKEFEIITKYPESSNNIQLPGGLLIPNIGDKYVIWNITMPAEYYSLASQELLEAAEAFAQKYIYDGGIYHASLDYIDVQLRSLRLRPGQRVRLQSPEYFPKTGHYDSRITRVTRSLWYPNEMNIDISSERSMGVIKKLSSDVKSAQTKSNTLSATLSTLNAAFVAHKMLFDEFFEKDSAGNIHAKLSLWSSGGITAGDAGSGGSGGGISYNRLDSWADYSADKSGWVLSALLGKDLDNRVSALANAGYITASYLAPYALRSEIPSLVGYATQSWVGENYLSKSGGKLVYSGAQGIEAERTDDAPSHIMFIGLVNGTSRQLGGFGMNGYNDPVYVNPNGIRHKVLTAENYTDYALSKNGGTISDLIIDRNPSVIQYKKNGASVGYLGFASELKPVLYNAEGNTAYMIVHSGNYSNLLAGGTINGGMTFASGNLIVSNGHTVVGELYPKNDGSIDLGQGICKWKDVYLGGYLTWGNSVDSTDLGDWEALKDNIGLRIISSKSPDSGAPYQYATALHVRGRYGFELAVQGGDIDSFAIRSVTNSRGWNRLLHSGNYSSYALPITGGTVNGSITATSFIGNLTGNADSADFVAKTYANENINFARDESKIRLVSGAASNSTDLGFPKQYTAGLSVVSSYCGWQMVCYGSNIDYNPYYRSVTDKGVWGYWRQIAFLTDNVASATKLQTPRTIWGQSFDGTGDIGGSLTNVGNIYSRGAQNAGYTIYSSIRWDEALSIETTDDDGNWCALAIAVKRNGNVAIGGTTADEKLHVHGNGKFTGALSSPAITTNTLKVGNVTLVEENGALKVIGGFIATGGVTSGEKAS